uniref:dual specificity protein kinase splB-like isoform X1 n=1 Tax=Styela clava TaxID=7725 RepID=UPI00193A1CFC|nr:dual specificity protein kinase splB-like isoform X1 [Styela clava]
MSRSTIHALLFTAIILFHSGFCIELKDLRIRRQVIGSSNDDLSVGDLVDPIGDIDNDKDAPLDSPRSDAGENVQPPNDDGDNTGEGVQPPNDDGDNAGEGVQPPNDDGDNAAESVQPPNDDGDNAGESVQPPNDDGDNAGESVQPPNDDGDNAGESVQPPNDDGDNAGESVQPPNDNGDNAGKGVQPPNDNGDNTGASIQPPNNDGDNTGENTQLPNDDGDNTGENVQPLNDDGDNNGESMQPPNDGNNAGENAQPSNDDEDNTGKNIQPPNDDGDNTGENVQPLNDDGDNTEKNIQPPNDDGDNTGENVQPLNDDGNNNGERKPANDGNNAGENVQPPNDDVDNAGESVQPPNDDRNNDGDGVQPPNVDGEGVQPPNDNVITSNTDPQNIIPSTSPNGLDIESTETTGSTVINEEIIVPVTEEDENSQNDKVITIRSTSQPYDDGVNVPTEVQEIFSPTMIRQLMTQQATGRMTSPLYYQLTTRDGKVQNIPLTTVFPNSKQPQYVTNIPELYTANDLEENSNISSESPLNSPTLSTEDSNALLTSTTKLETTTSIAEEITESATTTNIIYTTEQTSHFTTPEQISIEETTQPVNSFEITTKATTPSLQTTSSGINNVPEIKMPGESTIENTEVVTHNRKRPSLDFTGREGEPIDDDTYKEEPTAASVVSTSLPEMSTVNGTEKKTDKGILDTIKKTAQDVVNKYGAFQVSLIMLAVIFVMFISIFCCCKLCGRRAYKMRQRRLREFGQEKEFLLRDRKKNDRYSNDAVTLLEGSSEDEF